MHYNACYGCTANATIWRDGRSFSSTLDDRDHFFQRLAHGLAAGLEPRVGLTVQGFALGQDAAHVGERFSVAAAFDAMVALANDAIPVLFGRGLHPYREKRIEQALEGRRLGDESSARGKDHPRRHPQDSIERAAFVATVGSLAPQVEYLVYANARFGLDFTAHLDERPSKILRERLAQRAFPGASKPHQRDSLDAARTVAEALGQDGRRFRQFRWLQSPQALDQQCVFDGRLRFVA